MCLCTCVFLTVVIIFFSSRISTRFFILSSISLLRFPYFFLDTLYFFNILHFFRHVCSCLLKYFSVSALKCLSGNSNICLFAVISVLVSVEIFLIRGMMSGFFFLIGSWTLWVLGVSGSYFNFHFSMLLTPRYQGKLVPPHYSKWEWKSRFPTWLLFTPLGGQCASWPWSPSRSRMEVSSLGLHWQHSLSHSSGPMIPSQSAFMFPYWALHIK